MLARPTKSKVLFFQCIGRGLRLWPTKADCLLIDATGATKRHGLLSIAAELGLLQPKTPQEAPPVEEGQTGADVGSGPKQTGYHAHDINLAQRARLHWVQTQKGAWVVSLADRMLRVRADGQGTYRLEVRKRDERVYTRLVDRLSQEFCFGIASDTARDAQMLHMVREGARWRENARSPKQEALAQKLGIQIDPGWRSGELSDAIAAVTGDWYA
jgi:superfamily II DNA or RNA helicase